MPFLIRHRDGREYELDDVAYFQEHYQPDGFFVPTDQPGGRELPEAPDGFVWRKEGNGKVLAKSSKADKPEPPKEPAKTEPPKTEG